MERLGAFSVLHNAVGDGGGGDSVTKVYGSMVGGCQFSRTKFM